MLGKEPIFTIHAELEAITSLGRTPYGERRMIGILGGTVAQSCPAGFCPVAPIGRLSVPMESPI